MSTEVRQLLGLGPLDRIAFVMDEGAAGTVRLVGMPGYPTIASLVGAADSLPRPMPWREMRDIARKDYLEAKYGKR